MPPDQVIAVLTDEYIDYRKVFIDQIAEYAGEAGYGTVCVAGRELEPVGNYHQTHDVCNRIYPLISSANVKGVICLSGALGSNVSVDTLRQFIGQYSVPVVSLGLALPNVSSIVFDDSNGMKQLTEHLLQCTDRSRYAFVRGTANDTYSMRRERIFRETLIQYGRCLDSCFFIEGNYDTHQTYDQVSLLLTEQQIDVIVAANDQMALSAAKAVNAANLKIPQDILVSGFDDTYDATKNAPAITTVRQPLSSGAVHSTRLLIEAINSDEKDWPAEVVSVNSELVVRGSTMATATLTDAENVCSEPWLMDQFSSLMSGLPSPAGCELEQIAAALWHTLKTGSATLRQCLDRYLEVAFLRHCTVNTLVSRW